MTDRSHRDAEYVIIRDPKPKKPTRYYYDADDDNDSQAGSTTRRIIRTQPTKEQRIKYILSDEQESDYRRSRVVESKHHGIKIRTTSTGEQVVLDEDNNVLKIIRSSRSPPSPPPPPPPPPPPVIESQRRRNRPRESQTLFYETSDGHFTTLSSKHPSVRRPKDDFVYAEDEPTKILRKIIIDPRTGEQETIYEKEKPKKPAKPKYVIRKSTNEEPVDSDNEYEQQSQYVEVVKQRTVPKQEASTGKYMMIRKKVDNEPVYAAASSSIPASKNVRRIVYESPPKKTLPTYVYTSNGKYYK